ncbi:GNAT family N-acetyltransferase [Phycicoccus sp. CSK15P-2]|uniref:GNAT family N-acetyltransferase n=1 Tax=Phycicoccus sp. CSK15P-2 TaxID=2807627 RepID=UPI001950AEC1|nr:GNAT family N-acetyltransferase [Phycicoccus sp. CSK15P-2]MBM6403046.1 GNAT family N-acetyltransferase [Phycicoccus sp. CSK15P-2]
MTTTTATAPSRVHDLARAFTLRPVDPDADAPLLHGWLTHPRSHYWGMLDASPDDVRAAYAQIAADPHQSALVGELDGQPAFLAELYDPQRHLLSDVPEVAEGDVGMHVLVAPPDGHVPGLTRAVLRRVVAECLARPGALRVVVEPDVGNTAVHALNADVGFRVLRTLDLPDKTALLSVCTAADFAASGGLEPSPGRLGTHLAPERLARAARHVTAKALAELSHERVLVPERAADGWVVRGDDPSVEWTFAARVLPLEHWDVDPGSIRRTCAGVPGEPDPRRLVLDVRSRLDMPDDVVPVYLEELASTVEGRMRKDGPEAPGVDRLVDATFAEIEAAMTEGHPGFVANNGRLGLGARGNAAYTPEAARPVRLLWVAVRRDHAVVATRRGLRMEDLLVAELGADGLARLRQPLVDRGADPDEYVLVPCHPWQWEHKLAVTYAPEVAAGDLVLLGESSDVYRAQQSLRTFHNATRPDRHYVKTALSVLNMGFMRGLSAAYMEHTPAINDWVHDVVAGDPELAARGFSVLREVAAVGYRHPLYEELGPSGYTKMLAALWRETPSAAEGERLTTMAALLHVDGDGRSLAAAWVRASGLAPREWLRRYLGAYLVPVVHLLHAHGLVTMPHGENLILAMRGYVPVRAVLKDIGEEVAVLDPEVPLPPGVDRVRADVPDELHVLSVLTDVVDGVLRHLAGLLDREGVLGADAFWDEAARVVQGYRERHPELAESFARHDELAPDFPHSCLNRLQLRNNRQMVDLSDPASALALAGRMPNPLARGGGAAMS